MIGDLKKKRKLQDVGGFTLIELLVVIFIIGLLSFMAVSGYSRYRKISILELSADGVVSSLYETRDKVRLGEFDGGEDGAECFGLKFSETIEKVSAPFTVKKKLYGEKWVSQGCDFGGAESKGAVEEEELLEIDGVYLKGVSVPECSVLFGPPDGQVFSTCGGEGELTVVLMYGDVDDDSFKRTLSIDLETGMAKIQKINTLDEE